MLQTAWARTTTLSTVEWRLSSAECWVRSAACGVWSVECRVELPIADRDALNQLGYSPLGNGSRESSIVNFTRHAALDTPLGTPHSALHTRHSALHAPPSNLT